LSYNASSKANEQFDNVFVFLAKISYSRDCGQPDVSVAHHLVKFRFKTPLKGESFCEM